jgi:hypothetical protein
MPAKSKGRSAPIKQKTSAVRDKKISAIREEKCTSKLSAKSIWEKHVSQREPLKLLGTLEDKEWRGDSWTNDYLRKKAGSSKIRVEVRTAEVDGSGKGRFGKGSETVMTFKDFLDKTEQQPDGDCLHYLTTQDLEYNPEGQPEIVSEPVKQLVGEFPWKPSIMGNLVLQNANIWMGRSNKTATSSGLHHDFHDNLYVLLRGRKHFTLYPPQCHEAMYTNEEVVKLHANGRINYRGALTNADGSDPAAIAAMEASMKLQQADEEEDEEAVEAALEELLDAEMGSEEEEDDDNDDDEDDEDGVDESVMDAMRRKLAPALGWPSSSSSSSSSHGDNSKKQTSKKKNKTGDSSSDSTSSHPANFSRVDTSMPLNEIAQRFPLFASEAVQSQKREMWLEAGQMLYLPAGWFHEVTSCDTKTDAQQTQQPHTQQGRGGHLAFNYWFHPPDNLDSTKQGFSQPYTSPFWQRDWDSRGL